MVNTRKPSLSHFLRYFVSSFTTQLSPNLISTGWIYSCSTEEAEPKAREVNSQNV